MNRNFVNTCIVLVVAAVGGWAVVSIMSDVRSFDRQDHDLQLRLDNSDLKAKLLWAEMSKDMWVKDYTALDKKLKQHEANSEILRGDLAAAKGRAEILLQIVEEITGIKGQADLIPRQNLPTKEAPAPRPVEIEIELP